MIVQISKRHIKFAADCYAREGIGIRYLPTKKQLKIYGWYDSIVGISEDTIDLEKFEKFLGIKPSDISSKRTAKSRRKGK